MPNGTSAPGKVLPPLVVQVRVSTSCAGLVVAVLTVVVSVLAAGARTVSDFLAHDEVPPIVVVHVATRSPVPARAATVVAAAEFALAACAAPLVSTLPISAPPAASAVSRPKREVLREWVTVGSAGVRCLCRCVGIFPPFDDNVVRATNT